MLKERLGKEVLYFDGGMGTLLQEKGLQAGELPEIWNLTHMEEVIEIHRDYFEAGSDIVLTNTFGANALKFQDSEYELEDIVTAAVIHVKEAAYLGVHDDREVYTALDIGPTGKLLKPMGDLDFEDAYQAFAQVMRWGEAAGADLIHIETMSDTYEMKAAVLAAKEQTSLPVFATMIFDEKGRLLTGADVRSAMAMLEGLGVDALGINCGLGPEQMLPIFQEIVSHTSLPVIVKPNAGLPKQKDGAVYYDVTPKEFVRVMEKIVDGGAAVIGGCCGTTPGHIRNMTESFGRRAVKKVDHKEETVVSSYGAAVVLDDCPVVIGERINPTGKKRLKQALNYGNIDWYMEKFMKAALDEAAEAGRLGEIPIGAVVVRDGKIIASAHNLTETLKDPTAHAEILALRKAAEVLGGWRLLGCDMYVTIEPCSMCAGALVWSRIENLYIGAMDPKAGACGSVFDIVRSDRLNHRIDVHTGIMEEECRTIVREFFAGLREKKKLNRRKEVNEEG